MSKKENAVYRTDNNAVRAELNQLESDAKQLTAIRKEFHKELGADAEFSVSGMDKAIVAKTGFPNPVAGADLLGISPMYSKMTRVLTEINQDRLAQLTYSDEEYKIPAKTKQKIEERHTQYFSQIKTEALGELDKIAVILNNIPDHFIKAVKKVNGKYIVEKSALYRIPHRKI